MRLTQALELVDKEGFFVDARPREDVVHGRGSSDDAFCLTASAQGLLAQLYLPECLPLPRLVHRVELFALIALVDVRRLFLFAPMLHAIAIQFAFGVFTPKAGTLLVCGY